MSWTEPASRVRNRQVAARLLQAAATIDDSAARDLLRRRAARLITSAH